MDQTDIPETFSTLRLLDEPGTDGRTAAGRTREPRSAGAGPADGPGAPGDVLHSYMRSIRDIPVLSREQQYELAQEIRDHSDAFRAVMLSIPATADAVVARWHERRRRGRVSAALSRHYRDVGRKGLSEAMDRALERVETLRAGRAEARNVADRGRLQREITEALDEADLALEVLIDVYRELERKPARAPRARLREAGRAFEGLTRAKQQFVTHNLKLVVRYAKSFRRDGVGLLDLIQEGNLGLMRAVDKFDHRMGNTFSTYAVWWITQAMVRTIQKSSRTVRVPSHLYDLQLRHRRVEHELRARQQGEAERADIARELGLEPSEFDRLEATMLPIASTAKPIAGADDLTLEDALADESSVDPVDHLDGEQMAGVLARGLELLPERERQIVSWRFGLGGRAPETLEQVGGRLGLSRERVRQIEHRALGRLRDRRDVRELAVCLGRAPEPDASRASGGR